VSVIPCMRLVATGREWLRLPVFTAFFEKCIQDGLAARRAGKIAGIRLVNAPGDVSELDCGHRLAQSATESFSKRTLASLLMAWQPVRRNRPCPPSKAPQSERRASGSIAVRSPARAVGPGLPFVCKGVQDHKWCGLHESRRQSWRGNFRAPSVKQYDLSPFRNRCSADQPPNAPAPTTITEARGGPTIAGEPIMKVAPAIAEPFKKLRRELFVSMLALKINSPEQRILT